MSHDSLGFKLSSKPVKKLFGLSQLSINLLKPPSNHFQPFQPPHLNNGRHALLQIPGHLPQGRFDPPGPPRARSGRHDGSFHQEERSGREEGKFFLIFSFSKVSVLAFHPARRRTVPRSNRLCSVFGYCASSRGEAGKRNEGKGPCEGPFGVDAERRFFRTSSHHQRSRGLPFFDAPLSPRFF